MKTYYILCDKKLSFQSQFCKVLFTNSVTVLSFISVSGIPTFRPRANSKLNNASYEEKRSKFSKDQKQVLTLHNEMYCIINFLSFWLLLQRNITFFHLEVYVSRFFAAHELQSTGLDPDYGLSIGYQMPSDKYEDLNACLCLLTKNVNNFAELNIRSTNHMNHRSNTEYCESTSDLMLSLPAPCLTRSKQCVRTVCVMFKRLQMG